jgi:hypothetical protein
MVKYVRRFRETRNKCYSLTVRDKDLADLVVAGLSSYLQEKMGSHEFSDVNQVLQRAVVYENRARDSRSRSQFKEVGKDRECGVVDTVGEDPSSDDDTEVCVAEWVDTPKDKPITCSFLKLGLGKKDDLKFAFDVSKCDKLFDILLQNNIIKLKGGT